MTVQYIAGKDGRPAFAVIPVGEYEGLLEAAEDSAARAAFVRSREEERTPHDVVKALVGGANAVRVWRKHRDLTLGALAQRSGLSVAYISEIETGAKKGSIRTLRALARALDIEVHDLVSTES